MVVTQPTRCCKQFRIRPLERENWKRFSFFITNSNSGLTIKTPPLDFDIKPCSIVSMNIYAEKVSEITKRAGLNDVFHATDENIQERPCREGKGNRSMRKRFFGPQIHKAGMEFLGRIHAECKIGATEDELQEERDQLRQKNKSNEMDVGKPELTAAYLKSIGFENYASW
jgi:hypothetical protein